MKYNRILFGCGAILALTTLLNATVLQPVSPTESTTRQSAFQNHKEWFAAFLKNTDQKAVQKKVILQSLQTNFPYIWQKIQDPTYTFKASFIGVGSGAVEISLVNEWGKAKGAQNHFEIFCEDPSLQMRDEFFAAAEKGGIKEHVVEYSLIPFEDATYVPPQADLALASHVWYYIKSWRGVERSNNALVKFAQIFSERSGVGLITLHSRTSDRYEISSDYASHFGLEAELAGEEVDAELNNLGIQHKCEIVESHLNIESCFDHSIFNPNEEGKQLLSFILRAPWDLLSEEVQDRAKRIILSQVQANGKEELILRDCYIWISPN